MDKNLNASFSAGRESRLPWIVRFIHWRERHISAKNFTLILAVVVGLFAWFLSRQGVDFQLGAAYTGMFCMLGHAFPFQFKFKGGKGFLVCLSTMYVIDWRVGLIATGIMIVLLLITKYMSLSTTLAMLLCPILLIPFGASIPVILMATFCAVFMWSPKPFEVVSQLGLWQYARLSVGRP